MSIQVKLNGVDRTDFLSYESGSSWALIKGGRGTCSLAFEIAPDVEFTPLLGQSIEIYDGTERVWAGSVDSVSLRWQGDDGWHIASLSGVTLEHLFDTAEVDKLKYTETAAGDIVSAILTASGITEITEGTISAGPTVHSLEVTNLAQAFNDLANLAGFIWYVDPANKQLYFHAATARTASRSLNHSDILWESLDWRQSRQDFRNEQVIQLPGVSMSPVTAVFAGDGTTEDFTLPSIPEYILSANLSTGSTGHTIDWTPGTAIVTVLPALETGVTLTVRFADTGTVTETVDSPGAGLKTARYTQTRTFTPEGGLQEAQALLARYALLPSLMTLSTDRPGIGVGRKLTIDVEFPIGAGSVINGDWCVQEVEGSLVPGLEKKPEPFGHWRYRLHLINTATCAIFQPDAETETFILPTIPSSVSSIVIDSASGLRHEAIWTPETDEINVTPPLEAGDGMSVTYVDPERFPDSPSFRDTFDGLAGGPLGFTGSPAPVGGDIHPALPPETFKRDFTIYDTTVRDDAAPHTTVYRPGVGYRIIGVLRKAITSDLTVQFNKAGTELITVTIPDSTGVDEVLTWPLASGSPADYIPMNDLEVLTADITASDGSTDADGVAQFTVQWAETGDWVGYPIPVPE